MDILAMAAGWKGSLMTLLAAKAAVAAPPGASFLGRRQMYSPTSAGPVTYAVVNFRF